VPSSYTGNVFVTGVSYPVTAAISGGIKGVSWNGLCRSDKGSLTAKWQWSASVYTQFAADGSLGVKPVDSSTLSQYKNSDHAGTPESYKQYLTAGACGTGGTNYTGTYGTVCSPKVGSSCWLDSTSFQYGWWGYWGWDGTWANSITGGGGWGNGGSGNNSCGNGGDGAADGGWGSGWNNGNSNFGYGNW